MGHRAYHTQHPQSVQYALKKAKISFSVYRGGALTEYQMLPDLILSAVTGQLMKSGWKYGVHDRIPKLIPIERCGIKRFVKRIQGEEFADSFFIRAPDISSKQQETLRRQLKNAGWKYCVQSEVYRDGLGRAYPLVYFEDSELDILGRMLKEYRFADDYREFYEKNDHRVKQYAKKEVGPEWYKHPLVLIYQDLKTNIKIRNKEVEAEPSDMIVDVQRKQEPFSLENLVRQSA